ncbi:NADAR domain-containing protein [Silvimonas sp. JCM 19000]
MQDIQWLEALQSRWNAGERPEFVFFWGHQRQGPGVSASCLSQWYDVGFDVDGRHYPTAEHFMMAQKAALFGDAAIAAQIVGANTPAEVKALGRQVRGFDKARWEQQRFDIVVRGNLAKFSQNADLRAFLLGTGAQVLVEASPVDAIWGIGLAADAVAAHDPGRWQGLNLLGFALMAVRARLADTNLPASGI